MFWRARFILLANLTQAGMQCIYCGHEWAGKSMYCPRCGWSCELLPAWQELVAELIVATAATAVILWLALKVQ